jgi:hypothetical protein
LSVVKVPRVVRILWILGYGMSLLESPLWYEFIVTYNPAICLQQHLSQYSYGCSRITLSPPEINHRSPATASKAVSVVALSTDSKTRVMIVVERAQTDGPISRRFEVHVLADQLQGCHAGLYPL